MSISHRDLCHGDTLPYTHQNTTSKSWPFPFTLSLPVDWVSLSLTSLGSSDTINPLLFGADRGSRRVCRRQHKVSVLFLFLAIPVYFRCQVQVTTFSIVRGLMRKCDVLIRTVSTPHVLQLHHHVCSGSIRTEKTVPTRVPGLPIRDSARGCINRAQMCAQLSAIDVTATALFERLYLVL